MEILDFQIRHNQLGPMDTPTEHSMLAAWRDGPSLPERTPSNCPPASDDGPRPTDTPASGREISLGPQ